MVSIAESDDIPSLVELINSAYRGQASKQGWTTEADLFEGELRTDTDSIDKLMGIHGSVFLKSDSGEILSGCVYLQKQGNILYLGMLSVSPLAQSQGIGKKLLNASIEYGKQQGCSSILLHVISIRHELIEWYERHGFLKNGEKAPFPHDDRFGKPKQPLEFVILEKKLVDHADLTS